MSNHLDFLITQVDAEPDVTMPELAQGLMGRCGIATDPLHRSTHSLSCRGATVKNLAHSASFHSIVKIVPSNAGAEHTVVSSQTHG